MKMNKRIFPDVNALSHGALDELLRILREAIQQRGRFAIALSGGRTPAKLYQDWAANGAFLPWEKIHLFWSDERYVPKHDLLSNYRMTHEAMIAHVPIPAGNVHRVPGPDDFPTPEAAAEAYDAELRKFFRPAPPAFDLQLQGLGPEGHTASLFPGSPALEETKRWVMAVEAPAKPPIRLTFTPPVLNQGRNTFFLVAGADKRQILHEMENEPGGGPSRYPAGRIQPAAGVVWYLDQAAAD